MPGTRRNLSPATKKLLSYATKIGGHPKRGKTPHQTSIFLKQWQAEQRLAKALTGVGVIRAKKEDENYWPQVRPKGLHTAFINHANKYLRRGWRPLQEPIDPFGPVR